MLLAIHPFLLLPLDCRSALQFDARVESCLSSLNTHWLIYCHKTLLDYVSIASGYNYFPALITSLSQGGCYPEMWQVNGAACFAALVNLNLISSLWSFCRGAVFFLLIPLFIIQIFQSEAERVVEVTKNFTRIKVGVLLLPADSRVEYVAWTLKRKLVLVTMYEAPIGF